jgi:hypothetical protein
MILAEKMSQYSHNNIFFCQPIQNTILYNGVFVRIVYSTPYFSLNGIYIYFTLHGLYDEKFLNKSTIFFNKQINKISMENITNIESNILNKYPTSKHPQYKIKELLQNGFFKIYNNDLLNHNTQRTFIIKISGIWETTTDYGLTYKFSQI